MKNKARNDPLDTSVTGIQRLLGITKWVYKNGYTHTYTNTDCEQRARKMLHRTVTSGQQQHQQHEYNTHITVHKQCQVNDKWQNTITEYFNSHHNLYSRFKHKSAHFNNVNYGTLATCCKSSIIVWIWNLWERTTRLATYQVSNHKKMSCNWRKTVINYGT